MEMIVLAAAGIEGISAVETTEAARHVLMNWHLKSASCDEYIEIVETTVPEDAPLNLRTRHNSRQTAGL